MTIETQAKKILSASEYINIATCSKDLIPWNTPVTSVHDQKLNFFWSSWKKAQHSLNIDANPNIFITLYDSTRKRGDNHRKCLYIQAQATQVSNITDINLACELLYSQVSSDRNPEMFLEDSERKIYKAIPSKIWLNDVSERELTKETTKMRVNVSLQNIQNLIA